MWTRSGSSGRHNIAYVRWVYSDKRYQTGYNYINSWEETTSVLRYSLPRSTSDFLRRVISNSIGGTIGVVLVLGGRLYDMGTFSVECVATSADGSSKLTLRRLNKK